LHNQLARTPPSKKTTKTSGDERKLFSGLVITIFIFFSIKMIINSWVVVVVVERRKGLVGPATVFIFHVL
jgi:hypothetical protein